MLLLAGLLTVALAAPPTTWFSDVTDAAGIPSLRHGEGVNAVDIDADGLVDLYLPCVREQGLLLKNLGDGHFQEISVAAGLTQKGGVGAAIGDLNGDGRLDIYLARGADPYVAPNLVYLQQPDGRFTEASEAAGVSGNSSGLSAVLADFDQDGDADVFLPGWGRNLLFRNDGRGQFRDATDDAGLQHAGRGWTSLASDLDNDGDLDLLVNQGSYDQPRSNHLYRNLGDGRFEEVTEASGLAKAPWSMGPVSADFDGDGDFDLYIAGYSGPGKLFRNDGELHFTDVSQGSGLSAAKVVGAAAGPIDNDLLPDLVVGGFYAPAEVFRNLGDLKFERVEGSGLQKHKRNEGVALADFDNDGDLDLYVTNIQGHNRLYRNQLPAGRFLKVRLASTGRPLVGSVARLYRQEQLLATQELNGATGMGQGPNEFLFRLPEGGTFELTITLPDGRQLVRQDLQGGTLVLKPDAVN